MCRTMLPLLCVVLLLTFVSCSSGGFNQRGNTAVLWTDRPEFALYGEYFNSVQDQFKVEIRYFDSPAQKLSDTAVFPDIVAGSWLKSAPTLTLFKPLDKYLKNNEQLQNAFYPRLLALGNIDEKQYLLPVSFNAPAVVFARDKGKQLSSPFTIGFEEMKKLGKDFNTESGGIYTQMGFSPAWDDNFLFMITTLFDASFREGNPLDWDSAALEQAMDFACMWTEEANTGINAVEEFTFKYLYNPPAKLALSGRILFTCMDSDTFFTLDEQERGSLDFRWLAERNTIPLAERSVYMGLAKKGKGGRAAEAFLRWFFREDTQRNLLKRSRQYQTIETAFGIGGGFSAMRTVTEQVFPQFYPDLLGHMPPQDFLSPANILPDNWLTLKERVILPYLHDRVRQNSGEIHHLERRLTDWLRGDR